MVEGFFDCIAVWQAGIRRVVALMGSSLSSAQEELLLNTVGRNGRINLFLDQDEGGREGTRKAIVRLVSSVYVRASMNLEEGLQPDLVTAERLRDRLH